MLAHKCTPLRNTVRHRQGATPVERKAAAVVQWISVALKKYGSCGFRTDLGKRVHITCQITWDWTALQPLVSVCPPYDLHCYQFLHERFIFWEFGSDGRRRRRFCLVERLGLNAPRSVSHLCNADFLAGYPVTSQQPAHSRRCTFSANTSCMCWHISARYRAGLSMIRPTTYKLLTLLIQAL